MATEDPAKIAAQLVELRVEHRDLDEAIARLAGNIQADELTIKRLQRERRVLRLLPRNPAHAPIVVEAGQDFAIEGVYCGLVRQG